MIELQELAGFAGVGVVIGVTEGAKIVFPDMKPQFKPAVAVSVGVLWNLGLAGLVFHTDLAEAGFIGFAVGLVAAGLYTFGKLAGRVT